MIIRTDRDTLQRVLGNAYDFATMPVIDGENVVSPWATPHVIAALRARYRRPTHRRMFDSLEAAGSIDLAAIFPPPPEPVPLTERRRVTKQHAPAPSRSYPPRKRGGCCRN